MQLVKAIVYLVVTVDVTGASTWFSKAAYNKWHETELERWLSDNNIPYPTPADRKDLQKLVETNWNNYVVAPYNQWDTEALTDYLKLKGIEVQESATSSKDALVAQVKDVWYETDDKAQAAWADINTWILDTWTESQLKAFCDKHGIPVPQPRKRDTLLEKARASYETIAKTAGDAAAYPGNWLYETWSESDFKDWLDSYGIPAPQPSNRDKMIAAVRRNSHLAYLKMQEQAASASASAAAAYQTLTDTILDSWSDSDLKEFCDKNGIPVPQGSKTNELRALIRKNRAQVVGDDVSGKAKSAYGAATTKAGNEWAYLADGTKASTQQVFDEVVNSWSDSRLKAYLDARGVPVPQPSKTDELRALVRKHSRLAATKYNAWTFDSMSYENLKEYLESSSNTAAKKAGTKRDDLLRAAQSAYSSASSAGGNKWATVTSQMAKSTAGAKNHAFETWSEADLKAYIKSYGITVPNKATLNELKATARKQARYFNFGTTTPPSESLLSEMTDYLDWLIEKVGTLTGTVKGKTDHAKDKVKDEL